MKKNITYFLIALCAIFTFSSCEKEELSTDFSGMWALTAEYYGPGDNMNYDKIEEVLSFEGSGIKLYETKSYSGYDLEDGYLCCSIKDLIKKSSDYSIEPQDNKCYVFYFGKQDNGYIQIKGDKLYWYDYYSFGDGNYKLYKRIKGFAHDE